MKTLRAYYYLTKPGIIYGNAVNTTAGFLLAARGHVAIGLLLAVLVGSSLVIACGCVINNYIDRGIDLWMTRTKSRAFVTGSVHDTWALVYAVCLGVLGFLVLWQWTNVLTVIIGLIGLFAYLIPYSIGKRKTVHGTLIGSVSGAIPPVAGYTAASNRLDSGTVLLFLILVLWQIPHFYAIAMYRFKDYKKAGLPVWPVVKGMSSARRQILLYIVAFTLACCLLTVFHYTGYIFLFFVAGLGIAWLWHGIKLWELKDAVWGRKMFLFSLIVTVALAIMLALGPLLP